MPANPLIFADAEKARDAITAAQMKEIEKLYEEWADEIGERAKYYAHKSTASSVLAERQMKELQKQLRATSQQVSNEVYSGIKSSLYTVSDSVVKCNDSWMASFGFDVKNISVAFNHVPDEMVRMVVTGQVYQSGWSLSSRIWGDNEQTLKDIYQVVAKGMAENMPIAEIAKNLEAYVRPSAKLPWNLTAKDGVKIYKKKVDYNAQRLARTLIQHTYQQTFIAMTQKNPFITDYIWNANGSRVCELCKARDGQHFKKDELPMDHPNGMCVMIPNVVDNLEDQLVNWFNSPDGTYPEIDEFSKNFGYEPIGSAKDYIAKYGTSTKSPSAWFNSLTPMQKAEATALKNQSGLTWNQWYEQNIYAGDGSNLGGKKQPVFSAAQKKYLEPYGFSPTNMPKNFDDWSHKISYEQASEILKSMGTSWSDPHPYQKLMQYYNQNLTGVSSKVVKTTKAAKTAKTATTTGAFDAEAWRQAIQGNNLRDMENWCDDWLKVITSAQRGGIETYTGSAYEEMNEYLRGLSSSISFSRKQAIHDCTEALKRASLPQETIVRRGSGYNMLRELGVDFSPGNKSAVIGSTVVDKGFVSTSPASGGGFSGSIEYVIKLPEGSQAMYVAPISRFSSEKELLINRGGRYLIEDVEYDSYGDVRKIFMTLTNLKN